MSTPRLIFTSLSPTIPPATNSIGQQQEQIIGSDLVAPSPSPSPSPNPSLSIPKDGELVEEEKEKAELEIKQRLDDIGAGEEDDREGAGEESNNQEDISSDTTNDNETPLDLKLPVPFP